MADGSANVVTTRLLAPLRRLEKGSAESAGSAGFCDGCVKDGGGEQWSTPVAGSLIRLATSGLQRAAVGVATTVAEEHSDEEEEDFV